LQYKVIFHFIFPVLNLKTGHVSPQFHVKFDTKFDSVQGSLGNLTPESKWHKECGFKELQKEIENKSPKTSNLISNRTTASRHAVSLQEGVTTSSQDEQSQEEQNDIPVASNNSVQSEITNEVRRSKRIPPGSRYRREGI
jgi:predicted transcriptional regulator